MALRNLVSKSKKRYVDEAEGFDLDLTYITARVIAMGYPSVGREALYRNPASEVRRFFETLHAGKYKIYNLCSERDYSTELEAVFPRCERFPFPDHHAPDLNVLIPFCEDVHAWMMEDPENVAGIHCKAGKGRTGLMICCYLLFSGGAKSAAEALRIFGTRRTKNGKGVTIPSQQRYIWYFEQMLLRNMPKEIELHTPAYKLIFLRLITIPNFDIETGCDPYFAVFITNSQLWYSRIYDYRDHVLKIKHAQLKQKCYDFDVSSHDLFVRDNVRIRFWDRDYGKGDDHMFDVSFHTAFIESNYLCFEKKVLDGACKDKSNAYFDPAFVLELFFVPADLESKWATAEGFASMFPSQVELASKDRAFLALKDQGSGSNLSDPALTAKRSESKEEPRIAAPASQKAAKLLGTSTAAASGGKMGSPTLPAARLTTNIKSPLHSATSPTVSGPSRPPPPVPRTTPGPAEASRFLSTPTHAPLPRPIVGVQSYRRSGDQLAYKGDGAAEAALPAQLRLATAHSPFGKDDGKHPARGSGPANDDHVAPHMRKPADKAAKLLGL